ncbi:hypothetical protein BGX24_003258 [Mortierella sp. AD032]|nr:hypothetical protein BGX24_003258 [Mortierella sp. AD032]
MASPLPAFRQACLVPDHTYRSVYLIGSSNPGSLDVYYINLANVNAAKITLQTQETTTKQWNPDLPKYCFLPHDGGTGSSSVTAIQLGSQGADNTYMATFDDRAKSAGRVFPIPGIASATTRALAVSGMYSDKQMLSVYTNGSWVGLRVDLKDPGSFSISGAFNVSIETPLVAVGTYMYHGSNRTAGYSIVFNSQGGGTVYKASGEAQDPKSFLALEELKDSNKLNMTGIELTNSSVPVSRFQTAYIVDKSKSNTIVVYAITPQTNNMTLTEVKVSSGSIPQYDGSGSMAATYVKDSIVVYTLASNNAPSIYVFDTNAGNWNTLTVTSEQKMEKSTLSLVFSIIGWSVAALFVAFVIKKFWYCFEGCFRCLKRSKKNNGGSSYSDKPSAEESPKLQPVPLEKVDQRPDPAPPIPQYMASPYLSHFAAPFPESAADPYAPRVEAPFPGQVSSPVPQHAAYNPEIQQYVENNNSITMMGPGEQSNGSVLTRPYWPTQSPPSPLPSSVVQYAPSSSQYPPSPRFQPSPYQ